MLQRAPNVYGIILTLVGIAYPAIVYFGLNYFPPYIIGFFLIAIIILRLLIGKAAQIKWPEIMVLVCSLLLIVILLPLNDQLAIKIYPLTISFGFALIFIYSLFYPPNIIERFARIVEPELNANGVKYTQKVTVFWVMFFILNGCVSIWTALYCDIYIWTLYNGFISYVLIGILFAGEFVIRQFVKQNHVGEV